MPGILQPDPYQSSLSFLTHELFPRLANLPTLLEQVFLYLAQNQDPKHRYQKIYILAHFLIEFSKLPRHVQKYWFEECNEIKRFYSMTFRSAIADVGFASDNSCQCGRSFQALSVHSTSAGVTWRTKLNSLQLARRLRMLW